MNSDGPAHSVRTSVNSDGPTITEFDSVGIDVGSEGGVIDLRRGATDVTALHDALFHGPEAPNFVDNFKMSRNCHE